MKSQYVSLGYFLLIVNTFVCCASLEVPTDTESSNKDISADVNSIEQSIAETRNLFTRSKEPLNTDTLVSSNPEVEARLQTDYNFHNFNEESDEDKDEDYDDEDDELINGDIIGTNETMGENISTNHTTASNLNPVNGTSYVGTASSRESGQENSNTNPGVSQPEDTSTTTEKNHGSDRGNTNNTEVSSNPNTNIPGNLGKIPASTEGEASGSHGTSENVAQSNDASEEVSVAQDNEQNTGPLFRNHEQATSENTQLGNEPSRTNEEQGTNLNQLNTDQGNHTNTEGNNGYAGTSIQFGSDNSYQGQNLINTPTLDNINTMSTFNPQTESKPLSKNKGSPNTGTNNQNTQGNFVSQNEPDGSLMSTSQETQTPSNANPVQEKEANVNPDVNTNHLNAENQPLPENTQEGTKQEQHNLDVNNPTLLTNPDIQNLNEGPQTPQTTSDKFQSTNASPLEATGTPEYITAEDDRPQIQNSNAWASHTTGWNNGRTTKESDKGKG